MGQPEWVKIVWAGYNQLLDDEVNQVIAVETGNFETAEVVETQLAMTARENVMEMCVLIRFRGTLVTDPEA